MNAEYAEDEAAEYDEDEDETEMEEARYAPIHKRRK